MSAPRPYRVRAWRMRLSREEWLLLRRNGLGSSDAPVLLGLSPFSSPYSLWLDKIGQLVPREDTPHQSWGRRLEGVVAEWIREATAWPVQQAGAVLQSRPHPLLLADLDRWAVHPQHGRIPLEIKTTSPTQAAAWRDGPPPHVLAQVWHQCAVTGAPAAVVAVAVWGEAPRWWVVAPAPDDLTDLIEREETWWTTHVEGRVPPPVDDHPATTAALDAGPHDGPALILPPAAWDWLRERARLITERAAVERELEAVDNRMKAALGRAAVGLLDGRPAVRWVPYERTTWDTARLAADHPALAAQYSRQVLARRWDAGPGMRLVADQQIEGSEQDAEA
jgi:putative phage-type endonuclease